MPAEELHGTSDISEELWQRLCGFLGDAEIVELIVTAGWYDVIAYLCNGLRIEPEAWAAPWPAGR